MYTYEVHRIDCKQLSRGVKFSDRSAMFLRTRATDFREQDVYDEPIILRRVRTGFVFCAALCSPVTNVFGRRRGCCGGGGGGAGRTRDSIVIIIIIPISCEPYSQRTSSGARVAYLFGSRTRVCLYCLYSAHYTVPRPRLKRRADIFHRVDLTHARWRGSLEVPGRLR